MLGLLVGFRFHNSVLACLAGLGLVLLFGYAFTWVYAAVGLAVKDPQTAQMAAILPMFILFFASFRAGPRSHLARLAPAVCRKPASDRHGQCRAGSLRGRPRSPRPVAIGGVERRHCRGLSS